MPERAVRITHEGTEHDGVEVEIKDLQEGINTYNLADGTRLSMRTALVAVVRLDGVRNDQGEPTYVVRSHNVVSASVPTRLRKKMEE